MRSFFSMWIFRRRDEHVDAGPLGVAHRLPTPLSTSLKPVRDKAVMIGPFTTLAMASTDSKSPSERDREARFDHVDPEACEAGRRSRASR